MQQQLIVVGGEGIPEKVVTISHATHFTSHQSGKNFLNSGMEEYDDFFKMIFKDVV